MIQFDYTVTLGHIIQLIGFISAVIGLYFGLSIRLARYEERHTAVAAVAEEAKDIAIEAKEDVHRHVENFHTDKHSHRRSTD